MESSLMHSFLNLNSMISVIPPMELISASTMVDQAGKGEGIPSGVKTGRNVYAFNEPVLNNGTGLGWTGDPGHRKLPDRELPCADWNTKQSQRN